MIKLELTQGKYAIVDLLGYHKAGHIKWSLHYPTTRTNYYGRAVIKGKAILLHRYLLDLTDQRIHVDHINGDGLDCRYSNLRIANKSQNQRNSKKRVFEGGTSSKYKGVTWHKNVKKWLASIYVDGRRIHLGSFDTDLEAARAYNKAAIEHFGQYARPNVIEGEP